MNRSSQPYRADIAEAERRDRLRRRRLLISGGVGLAMGLLAVLAWLWAYLFSDLPRIPPAAELWSMNRLPGMTFLDRDGATIATRGPRHGQRVPLARLPAYVPRAFLAAEDRRFYEHGPVELRGLLRAASTNASRGRLVQGGSTITQQLARNLMLGNERTFRRKLQEAVIAYRLEWRMSKDQLLELYLNRIFFGAGSYGIEAASRTYFAKPASELSLSEAALLASLPKAPSRLALNTDLDAAVRRSQLVLTAMVQEGWISDADRQAALASRPAIAPRSSGEAAFGYVLDMAAAQAARLAGERAPDLVVRTTIDAALQAQVQTELRDTLAREGAAGQVGQGAVVVLAPDGAVQALAGGADYRQSPFNRAVQARRQPGSAFKPFVYAAALERGVQPTDIRQDAPFRVGDWAPQNYTGGYVGAVSVQDSLAQSLNTVAARLATEVGRERLGQTAQRFGLNVPDNPALSVALGAYETSLLELSSAYQVFQNGGRRSRPYLVTAVTTARGDPLYLRQPAGSAPVFDPARAATMVRMMAGVIDHGTGVRAQLGRPAAGKTGTSQNWRDAWFVGFTPDFAAGVWIGNDDGRPMARVAGGTLPADLWRRVMTAAHQGLPVRDFEWIPGGVAEAGAPAPQELPDPRNAFYETLASEFGRVAAADARLPDPGLRRAP